MFPNSQHQWVDFAMVNKVDPKDIESKQHHKWRNKILDAQAFWAHDHAGRDVFVSSDGKFKRLLTPEFGNPKICTPEEAVKIAKRHLS